MKNFIKELFKKYILTFEDKIFYKSIKKIMFSSHLEKVFSSSFFNTFKKPDTFTISNKAKVLVISPHPDDEAIAMGGTLRQEISVGSEISIIYCTHKKASIRGKEAKSLCDRNNFSSLFLEMEDGNIQINNEIIGVISDYINEIKPNKIYLPLFCDDHDDHKRCVELFYKFLQNTKNSQVTGIWCYQVYGLVPATHLVDISKQIREKKELINYYKSEEKKRHWAHWVLGSNAYQSRFLRVKNKKSFAESYLFFEIEQFRKLCKIYFSKKKIIYSNRNYR